MIEQQAAQFGEMDARLLASILSSAASVNFMSLPYASQT